MKATSAAVLIQPMDPASVAGASLVLGLLFFVTGLVGCIARIVPPVVTSGLQLGLLPVGLGLGVLAAAALVADLPLAAAAAAVMLLSLGYDMTQPLFASIVTSLGGGRRPGQVLPSRVHAVHRLRPRQRHLR